MNPATTTARTESLSVKDAREELAKFFQIAGMAEKAPEMFSAFIDAEWHRLLESGADYTRFCMESVGHLVGHREEQGHGVITWVELYHERFGTLPASWFADAGGTVDEAAYRSYLETKEHGGAFSCHGAPPPCQPDMSAETGIAPMQRLTDRQ